MCACAEETARLADQFDASVAAAEKYAREGAAAEIRQRIDCVLSLHLASAIDLAKASGDSDIVEMLETASKRIREATRGI